MRYTFYITGGILMKKQIKELDFVVQHIEKVMNKEMTSEELRELKKQKIASGEVIPMQKSKNTSFEFDEYARESNHISDARWDQLEREYHQSKLLNSDA